MTLSTPALPPKIGFVSLGCPKALVDSEQILTRLRAEGYLTVNQYKQADLVIINTCGFIDSAVQESLDTIAEALKENGRVLVTGCLGARQNEDGSSFVAGMHPKVLAVTGPHATQEVLDIVHEHLPKVHDPLIDLIPPAGVKLTPKHYAYLKISEGCNHRCSFCIIPSMRGDLVSRPIHEVLDEAEKLFSSGVKELLVISQDTSAYGIDIKFRTGFWRGRPIKTHIFYLTQALGELAKSHNAWVRLHYVYPYPHVDQLIPLMNEGHILPYLDVPLQHAHPEVLKRMKRPASGEKNSERIAAWRKICPDITLRSTFITGFPGETEEEFAALLEFIQHTELDRVGCFAYSPVSGAKANELPNPVPDLLSEERRAQLMLLQQDISKKRLQAKIGKTMRVLIDQINPRGAIARSSADAPEIDGVVYIQKPYMPDEKWWAGQFLDVRINAADEHDLWASIVE